MDLKKEAFKFGKGPDLLYLIFNRESAQDIISQLNFAIRPKDQKGRGCAEFYMGITGKVSDIKIYTRGIPSLQDQDSVSEDE